MPYQNPYVYQGSVLAHLSVMEWAARVMGAFYILAGAAVLHRAVLNWRMDRVVVTYRVPPVERAAEVMLTLGGALVLLSGLSLVLLHPIAKVTFLTAWTAQAGYLLWAQRWHRPEDPYTADGRRQTLNAFAVYSVATLIVLGLCWAKVVG